MRVPGMKWEESVSWQTATHGPARSSAYMTGTKLRVWAVRPGVLGDRSVEAARDKTPTAMPRLSPRPGSRGPLPPRGIAGRVAGAGEVSG
jgi:hypothetical protein